MKLRVLKKVKNNTANVIIFGKYKPSQLPGSRKIFTILI